MSDSEQLDRVRIAHLILQERVARDTGRWDQMRACYSGDARVDISWFRGSGFDFVDASREAADSGSGSFHKMEPCLVDVRDDRAIVDVGVAIHLRTLMDKVEVLLIGHGRMLFRVERTGSNWLINHLTGIYVMDTLQPAVPGEAVSFDRERLAAYRSSYRYLSYLLEMSGRPVSQDLPGVDRPDSVDAILTANTEWLNQQSEP
ncbi:nuclear transport factor 2 family protein [Henriciella litoralis]|uniref:nuclear transport factor 2 family protein n=1 Tax=Henriciella litoralis TaxID=568102 RepID=UPI00111C1803|nr:nuclear transport factor 2 family protein [Henriciella litoralis]